MTPSGDQWITFFCLLFVSHRSILMVRRGRLLFNELVPLWLVLLNSIAFYIWVLLLRGQSGPDAFATRWAAFRSLHIAFTAVIYILYIDRQHRQI